MALNKHASKIASPIASYPSKALTEILGAILQRRLYLCLLVVLHCNFPAMRVHPSSDKIVIIRIQLARAPLFVGETMRESFILQNAASIRNCSAGKAWQAAVNVQTG